MLCEKEDKFSCFSLFPRKHHLSDEQQVGKFRFHLLSLQPTSLGGRLTGALLHTMERAQALEAGLSGEESLDSKTLSNNGAGDNTCHLFSGNYMTNFFSCFAHLLVSIGSKELAFF